MYHVGFFNQTFSKIGTFIASFSALFNIFSTYKHFFFHLALVVYHQASKWKDVKFFPLAYLLAANVTFFGLAFSKLQRD